MKNNKAAKKQELIGEYNIEILALLDMFKGNGAYKIIQQFLLSKKVDVSIGSIASWIKNNTFDIVDTDRIEYGSGHQVKIGRTTREKFTCKSNGENYVKLAEKWVKEYTSMMTDVLREENDADVVIHHLDGNHMNNDKSNLKIMTRSEHSKLHAIQYWKNKKNETLQM